MWCVCALESGVNECVCQRTCHILRNDLLTTTIYLHHTINTNTILWAFNWIIFCAISVSIHILLIPHNFNQSKYSGFYAAYLRFHWTLAFEHIKHSQSITTLHSYTRDKKHCLEPLWDNQVGASLAFQCSDWQNYYIDHLINRLSILRIAFYRPLYT